MLDDLRNSAGSPFLDEEPIEEENAKPKINSSNFFRLARFLNIQ